MKTFSQKSLEHKVLKFIEEKELIPTSQTVVVALSGGPDSVCLFNLLLNISRKKDFSVIACHYNHRLRGDDSDKDQKFVEKICSDRGVVCIVGRAESNDLYKNEEEARDARFAFFKKILEEGRGSRIALAHNSNDLIETFLLRLVRGSGLKGLVSISPIRENFIRPLLSTSRVEIENYLEINQLDYRIDKSNDDTAYDRNFLRHKILPQLLTLNPNLVASLSQTANLVSSDYKFINELAINELAKISQFVHNTLVISRQDLLLLAPQLRRMVLRAGIDKIAGLKDITQKQLDEVCELIQKGSGNKHKLLPHSLRIELLHGKIIMSKIKLEKDNNETKSI